jgi:hypothetical protein
MENKICASSKYCLARKQSAPNKRIYVAVIWCDTKAKSVLSKAQALWARQSALLAKKNTFKSDVKNQG